MQKMQLLRRGGAEESDLHVSDDEPIHLSRYCIRIKINKRNLHSFELAGAETFWMVSILR
jgi:hypothetical protein